MATLEEVLAAVQALDAKIGTAVNLGNDIVTVAGMLQAMCDGDDGSLFSSLASLALIQSGNIENWATIIAKTNLIPAQPAAVGDLVTAAEIDALLSATHGAGAWGGATAGAGAIPYTYTLTSTVEGGPIIGAQVWATTDVAGNEIVASGVTNSFGVVTFYLDAGTYYVWRQKAGWNFTNPDTEVVS